MQSTAKNTREAFNPKLEAIYRCKFSMPPLSYAWNLNYLLRKSSVML